MARRNIKQYEGYNHTFWYQEYLQIEGSPNFVYSTNPIRFRGDKQLTDKVKVQLLPNSDSSSVSEIIETRFKLPFKQHDKILNSLAKNDIDEFVDFVGRIDTVKIERDKEMDIRNLRSTSNDEIYFLTIG